MQNRQKIKTLNDLRRQKRLLQKQIKLRGKILNVRLRKFEQNLTLPNITRELFKGSKLEYFAPLAASYLVDKFKSGKNFLSILGGFLAGFGSIFSIFKRRKARQTIPVTEKKFQKNEVYKEDQMFI